MADGADRSPGLARRVGFWALLGLVSTAFAEVLFPTTPFDPVTLLFVAVPVYLLHSVVLAGVVFRAGVTYPALYLAGVLLGLYEAYVTKVVWAPVGDPIPVRVAGIYPFETASLLLFWHPVVAFVLPVAVVEAVATRSRRSLVPPLVGHPHAAHLAVASGAYLAVFQGTLGGPVRATLSNAVAIAVLSGSLALWRRTGGHRYPMGSLLPSGRELPALGAALLALYALFGTTLRPGALPDAPVPHLVVLAAYVLVGGAFLATLRRADGTGARGGIEFTWPRALAATGGFVLASVGSGLSLAPFGTVVFLSYFAVGAAVGAANLAYLAVQFRREDGEPASG